MLYLEKLQDPRIFYNKNNTRLYSSILTIINDKNKSIKTREKNIEKILRNVIKSREESEIKKIINNFNFQPVTQNILDILEKIFLNPKKDDSIFFNFFFTIPIIFVMNGSPGLKFPMVLSNTDTISKIFQEAGVLGYAKNLSFSNSLPGIDSILKTSWYDLLGYKTNLNKIDLMPEKIFINNSENNVFIRYLSGVILSSKNSPNILETSSDISMWSGKLSKYILEEIKIKDTTILIIPRRPIIFPKAPLINSKLYNETCFQLFVSDIVREVRLKYGEPNISIYTKEKDSININFSTTFEDEYNKTFVWKLSPFDIFENTKEFISGVLHDCKVKNIEVL